MTAWDQLQQLKTIRAGVAAIAYAVQRSEGDVEALADLCDIVEGLVCSDDQAFGMFFAELEKAWLAEFERDATAAAEARRGAEGGER